MRIFRNGVGNTVKPAFDGTSFQKEEEALTASSQTVDKLDENRVCLFLWLVQFGR